MCFFLDKIRLIIPTSVLQQLGPRTGNPISDSDSPSRKTLSVTRNAEIIQNIAIQYLKVCLFRG